MRHAAIMLVVASSSAAFVAPLTAQCTACRVSAQRVAVLGNEEKAPVGPIHTVATFRDGRIALSFDASDDEIMIFDPNGSFRETIGSRGQGPGEYGFIRFLRNAPRGIAALDPRLRRVTLIGEDLELLGTLPLELDPMGDAIMLRDTLYALNAVDPRPDRMGPLVHLISPSGVQKSFGADPDGFRFDLAYAARRLLAASTSGLWVANRTKYEINEYALDGQHLRRVARAVPWFAPHVSHFARPGPDGPAPFIIDIQEVDGRLWVMIAVPDADWASATTTTPEGTTYSSQGGYFDTRVEVIDPATGRVIASNRFDQYFAGFHASGLTSYYEEGANAVPRISIVRLTLTERTD